MDSVRRTYTIMRGRHIDKRVPSKEFLSALDKAETAVRLPTGTGKDCGNPSWKRSLPHVLVASLTSLLFGYHLGSLLVTFVLPFSFFLFHLCIYRPNMEIYFS
jgi:hypothetical protein